MSDLSEYRMPSSAIDWPDDAIPLTPLETQVECEWPGTIKPYRGFATRADFDEAWRQLQEHGSYRAEYSTRGAKVIPRD